MYSISNTKVVKSKVNIDIMASFLLTLLITKRKLCLFEASTDQTDESKFVLLIAIWNFQNYKIHFRFLHFSMIWIIIFEKRISWGTYWISAPFTICISKCQWYTCSSNSISTICSKPRRWWWLLRDYLWSWRSCLGHACFLDLYSKKIELL